MTLRFEHNQLRPSEPESDAEVSSAIELRKGLEDLPSFKDRFAGLRKRSISENEQIFVEDKSRSVAREMFSANDETRYEALQDLLSLPSGAVPLADVYRAVLQSQAKVGEHQKIEDRVISYLTNQLGRPDGFKELITVLDDNWLGQRVTESLKPELSLADEEKCSLTEYAYHALTTSGRVIVKEVAAYFLTVLPIDTIVSEMVEDLDNPERSIRERCYTAEILGYHRENTAAMRGLLNQVFPVPYESFFEMAKKNPGQIALATVTGAMGTLALYNFAAPILARLGSIFLMGEGVAFFGGGAAALTYLYYRLNKPRIEHPSQSVIESAASALGHMIVDRVGVGSENVEELRSILKENLHKIEEHSVRAKLLEALEDA